MEELTHNTTKKYFTKYMMLWIIGWLLIFPVFFFFNWKKKIANANRQILNIKQTMLSVCQIYHKKYITLLQTEIRNWNDAKNKEIFETQFTKYYHFKLDINNFDTFLKLHKYVCDHFIYLSSKMSTQSKMNLINLNDDFNGKLSIYALTINGKIIQNSSQYKRWPKNIFYAYLAKNQWVVWY